MLLLTYQFWPANCVLEYNPCKKFMAFSTLKAIWCFLPEMRQRPLSREALGSAKSALFLKASSFPYIFADWIWANFTIWNSHQCERKFNIFAFCGKLTAPGVITSQVKQQCDWFNHTDQKPFGYSYQHFLFLWKQFPNPVPSTSILICFKNVRPGGYL